MPNVHEITGWRRRRGEIEMIPVSGDEYIRPIKRKVSNSELVEPLDLPTKQPRRIKCK